MDSLYSLKKIYSFSNIQLNEFRTSLHSERINNKDNMNIDNIINTQKKQINDFLKQQNVLKNYATPNKLNKIHEISSFLIDLYNDVNTFDEKIKKSNMNKFVNRSIPLNSNISMNINNNYDNNNQQDSSNVNLGNIDPYKLYGFEDKRYDEESLKRKFREYALQTHPDKNNGNSKNFNIVKNAYKFLYEELKKKEVDKSYLELKNNSRDFITNQQNLKNSRLDDNFDLNKFNSFYDENKIEDESNYGYKDWMENNKISDESIIKNTNLNKGNFNTMFDKNVKVSNEIINYDSPKTLFMNEENNVLVLGGKTDNFTGKTKNMAYTDYREAHSNSRLVNTNMKYKTYDNIDEYNHARSNIKDLTQEELSNIEMQKQKEKEAEEKRVQNLQYQDRLHFQNYEKINKLMLR